MYMTELSSRHLGLIYNCLERLINDNPTFSLPRLPFGNGKLISTDLP